MATVNFLYRSTKPEAFLNLRLLYRFNNKDYVIGAKTQLKIDKLYWMKFHNQKKPRDIEIANKQVEVNQELNKIENHVLDAFQNSSPASINKSWLQLNIGYYYKPPTQKETAPLNLVNYIDYYLKIRKHEMRKTSITKYNVIKHKLMRMEENRGRPIMIKEINEDFKTEFVQYYKDEKYSTNTTQRELGFIKTLCRHAKSSGLEVHPQLDQLKLKKENVEKIFLSFEELEKIEEKEDLPEHLINARDWLIISCFLGQRISDFMRFTKEMIRIENGKHLIEFTQKKTGKKMTVPLHKKVLEILEKRNGEFPRAISDQRYNDYIKDVCEAAKLNQEVLGSKQVEVKPGVFRKETKHYKKWELVTSHIGRRSFATNFYGKIPTTYIIYITGHSSEAVFLNYVGKSNKDLAMEITNYF